MLKIIEEKISLWAIAAFTLGLAPFSPEPHVWGKLKWILGGAVGMKPLDWGDFIMHGAPWFLLILAAGLKLKSKIMTNTK